MSDIDDLYRDVILDHYQHPRNHGCVNGATLEAEGVNPLCGDQIHLTAKVDGGRIVDVKTDGHGCSISQASASLMTEVLKGKTLAEALLAIERFKKVMLGGESADNLPEDMSDLAALEGVKKYPVRLKCALLAWNTLLESLAREKKG